MGKRARTGDCQKCGAWRETLHRDHIEPKWQGGADAEDNYQYLCANCHEDKTLAERKTPEFRALIGAYAKERMADPAARANLARKAAEANAARVWTDEARAKCGAATRGRTRTLEERLRISESRKGRPKSEAHRASLRAAHVGRPWSPARRAAYEASR